MINIKKKDYVGLEGYNNFGSKMIVTRSNTSKDIDIYFPQYDWTYKNGKLSAFRGGKVKCPYERRYCGVGYIGEGEHKVCENGKDTHIYKVWIGMLKRCYDENANRYDLYGGSGATVCEEWHNFQNFAEWYEENYYQVGNERMEIDKDILIKGNKIYSPQTCIIVPRTINSLFVKSNSIRGDYPIGVSKGRTEGKFAVRCNYRGREKGLGEYFTIKEAFNVYKYFKENYIKEVADEYKPYIPKELYDAMYRYKVEITD